MANEDYVVHPYPVWGDIADSLVFAKVDDEDDQFFEQLNAKRLDEGSFRICCIPGFVKGIALGDIVLTSNEIIRGHMSKSGRFVFRAWSDDGWNDKHEILHELASAGALMETCTDRLLGIDAENMEVAQRLRGILEKLEAEGLLVYDTGWE